MKSARAVYHAILTSAPQRWQCSFQFSVFSADTDRRALQTGHTAVARCSRIRVIVPPDFSNAAVNR